MQRLTYLTAPGCVRPEQISGFFVGWPTPPSAQQLVDVMDGSCRRVWALERDRVVGYVSAISDGVLNAFIPWLEVHPDYQGRGVGSELMRRILKELDGMYAVDLACDPELLGYYEQRGFVAGHVAHRRDPSVLRG
ncbi:GNAT family N-acetyltransferase [Actinomyces urogenitalis]|uniref:GNAT family N-acetyltransferase n=1 Tax=Actinomyces urogenitalis TaxID=103621 RepID=UPI00242D4029|nr:GNAT family N-acetyltransferase [Actinomyces urogenitalis]MCI7456307.1 GNAT family N-acetyltransferase [Actinomyces urogenitalis]